MSEIKYPKIGLGVMIIKDNRVLMGKRKGSHGDKKWAWPGGHIEFGETWEQCARREVKEEVGIAIKDVKLITATNDIMVDDNKHYITILMQANYSNGTVKNLEPHKCVEWKWFAWDELPSPLFLPIENLIKSGFKPSIKSISTSTEKADDKSMLSNYI